MPEMHFCLLAQLVFKLELFLLKRLTAGEFDKKMCPIVLLKKVLSQ